MSETPNAGQPNTEPPKSAPNTPDTKQETFFADVLVQFYSLALGERLYATVLANSVFVANSFKKLQEETSRQTGKPVAAFTVYTVSRPTPSTVLIGKLSKIGMRSLPVSEETAAKVIAALGLDRPIPPPQKGYFNVVHSTDGTGGGEVIAQCATRLEAKQARLDYEERQRREIEQRSEQTGGFQGRPEPLVWHFPEVLDRVVISKETGYQPPAVQPYCCCKGNPMKQNLCMTGHLTECHFPLSCADARCGHFEQEQQQEAQDRMERWDVFAGKTVSCLMCGITHSFADERPDTDWRYIEAEGAPFFVCPAHFPADTATSEEFSRAYQAVIREATKQLRQGNSQAGNGGNDAR